MSRQLCAVAALIALVGSAEGSPAAAGATGAATSPLDYEKASSALRTRTEALRVAYQSLDWPADSPAQIGRLLRSEPQACRAFIRRAMRFEPYRGILRGPEGALAAGGGNSADLALLLRDMIRSGDSPPTVRFAVGRLEPDQAAPLVESSIGAPPAQPVVALSPPDLHAQPDAAPPASPRAQVRADDPVAAGREDLRQIEPLLNQLPQAKSSDRDEALQAAREHVWVQVLRDGQWVTLDPSADLPLPPGGARLVDELPADWNHRVRLALELERLEGDRLSRETLLAHDWKSNELAGKAIELLITPREMSLDAMLDAPGPSNSFLRQAKKFEHFDPSLIVGDQPPQPGRAFDLRGQSAAPSGGSPFGALDPFGRARPRAHVPSSQVSGIWLTIALDAPGGKPRRIERALLDRIGPAGRATGKLAIDDAWKDPQRVRVALLQRHQLLVTAAPISTERVARDALQVLAEGQALEQALALKHRQTHGPMSKAILELKLPALPADLIAVQNDSLALAQSQLAGEGICFAAGPQVYVHSDSFDLRGGELIQRTDVDIAEDDLCFLSSSPAAVQSARLLHGLWASELEGRVISAAGRAFHAAAVLREVGRRGELHLIRTSADLASIDADSSVKAVMSSQLTGGCALVAPAKGMQTATGTQFAWWRIDPGGQVLAIGPDGRGQATEGQMVLTNISIPMVRHCMKFVACFNKAVSGGGGMNESAADCLSESIRDVVKESLDAAIDTFVKDPIKEKVADARKGMLGEEYNALYEKAKKAYEAYKKAQSVAADPAGQVPGVKEGRDAADAGRQIGASLGFRLYLLLSMGRDIADYSSQL